MTTRKHTLIVHIVSKPFVIFCRKSCRCQKPITDSTVTSSHSTVVLGKWPYEFMHETNIYCQKFESQH